MIMNCSLKIAHLIPAHPTLQNTLVHMLKVDFEAYNHEIFILQLNESIMAKLPTGISASKISLSTPLASWNEMMNFCDIFKKFDLVVFHSIQIPINMKLFLASFHPGFFKKMIWIEWGFDLYIERIPGIVNGIKHQIKKLILKIFERKIPYFVAIHPADVKKYHQTVKGNAQIFSAQYRGSNVIEYDLTKYCKTSMICKRQCDEPIYIQINHRADRILDHKEVIDKLSKYKEENIRVVFPLCYGDKEYGDVVASYASNVFGEKAICIREIMAYDKYIELLKKIDIFILNSNRQIALGNLNPMIRMQKKIYMPKTSVLYEYYNRIEECIQDYYNIDFETFEEFTSDIDMSKLSQNMDEYLAVDCIEEWKNIFESIGKDYLRRKK